MNRSVVRHCESWRVSQVVYGAVAPLSWMVTCGCQGTPTPLGPSPGPPRRVSRQSSPFN
jgi:hypothetical protein